MCYSALKVFASFVPLDLSAIGMTKVILYFSSLRHLLTYAT